MTTPQEGLESVAERARRALRDNDAARIQAQQMAREAALEEDALSEEAVPDREMAVMHHGPGQNRSEVAADRDEAAVAPLHQWDGYDRVDVVHWLDQRLQAVHLVRELEPRRACFRQRVQELSRRLGQTPTDSVHYADLLERLAEAHRELSHLEAHVEASQHLIRSTEWLMELLTDPARA